MSSIFKLHALPVYQKSNNFVLTETERKKILSLDFVKDGYEGVNISNNSFILEDPDLVRIKDFLNDAFAWFKDNVLEINNDFRLTQSWATINKMFSYHHKHNHPNSMFSIVYYAEVESGDLMLDFPYGRIQERFNFSYDVKNWNEFNSHSWRFKLNTGDILIFPSWLDHYSTPNQADSDRIIIGANYFITGTVGNTENVDLINL